MSIVGISLFLNVGFHRIDPERRIGGRRNRSRQRKTNGRILKGRSAGDHSEKSASPSP